MVVALLFINAEALQLFDDGRSRGKGAITFDALSALVHPWLFGFFRGDSVKPSKAFLHALYLRSVTSLPITTIAACQSAWRSLGRQKRLPAALASNGAGALASALGFQPRATPHDRRHRETGGCRSSLHTQDSARNASVRSPWKGLPLLRRRGNTAASYAENLREEGESSDFEATRRSAERIWGGIWLLFGIEQRQQLPA